MATLVQIRQQFARVEMMQQFFTGTATSGSGSTVLEDTAWPFFAGAIAKNDIYEGWYLFRPNAAGAADKVRQVPSWNPNGVSAPVGYDAANGKLYPDVAWANSPNGETYELHGHGFEPGKAIPDIINQALKSIFAVVEFTLTPVAQQTRHSLAAAASWLTVPDWVYQVGRLSAGDDRNQVDPYEAIRVRGWPDELGGTVYLNHPGFTFNTTDTLYVKAIRPAYTFCRASGGAFGDQSGLTLDTDECVPGAEWAAAAAALEAWYRDPIVMEQAHDTLRAQGLARAAGRRSAYQRAYFRTQRLQRTFRPYTRMTNVSPQFQFEP